VSARAVLATVAVAGLASAATVLVLVLAADAATRDAERLVFGDVPHNPRRNGAACAP
jgi:hypothetical protein